MPTDGTILLENVPRGKEYLVTALSVFCSFGSVVAAFVAIVLIPDNSCDPLPAPCDLDRNLGWKYELAALGVIVCTLLSPCRLRCLLLWTKTLTMFIGRILFFRLHESPRYLVQAGRPEDALESLRMISRFNGSELELDLKDVEDHIHVPPRQEPHSATHSDNSPTSLLFEADDESSRSSNEIKTPPTRSNSATPLSSEPPDGAEGAVFINDYSATGESRAPLTAYAINSATEHHLFPYNIPSASRRDSNQDISPPPKEEDIPGDDIDVLPAHPHLPRVRRPRAESGSSIRSSMYEVADCAYWSLPRNIRRPVRAWFRRFMMPLEPEWRRTTLLVWAVWYCAALAYTLFNVYLPKLLETRRVVKPGDTKSLERTLWEVVIFTIGGCPGSIVSSIRGLLSL
jgi:hypothetical protein